MAEFQSVKRIPAGDNNEQVPWSELPALALERIYSFLDRYDRANMSLVCRNWYEEFNSPSLWESYRLVWIDDYIHNVLNIDPISVMRRNAWQHPDITFVRKYSRLFKHVDIHIHIGEQFSDSVLEYWCDNFKQFLQIFTETSQLDSVRFRGLSYFCYQKIDEYVEFPIYEDSCQKIAIFLGSQRQLKRLEFHSCDFEYKDIAELLNKSFESSKDSLRILVLENIIDYFDDEKEDSADFKIMPSIFSFPKLTTLTIDYWLVFGTKKAILSDVLKKLKNCQKQTVLKVLTVIDDKVGLEKFELLQSSDWRFLKIQYPYLEVELNVGRLPASLKLPEVFIVEYMPITRLEYHFEDYSSLIHLYLMEVDAFLGYLLDCKINDHLLLFRLSWAKPISNLASAFIPFLNACKNLELFDLSTVYPPNNLEDLLESLLVNPHKSLREFQLTVYSANSRNNIAMLKTLISEFESRFKSVRINLEVIIHI